MDRVKKVRKFRLASTKAQTRDKAQEPSLFAEIRQPNSNFMVIPQHSSENRKYIPFGFFSHEYILHNSCSAVKNATFYHFGIISSLMHMVWVHYTCGRIKSDYRYSTRLVYNNYPWPIDVSSKQQLAVENAVEAVIEKRLEFEGNTLSDLYDPLSMPISLIKAHEKLDKAVDLCYRSQPFPNETSRITFLFDMYNKLMKG